MLQFTAGGHVLGFWKGGMVIASGDHALRIDFVNAQPIFPGEEMKSPEQAKNHDAAQPLGKVSYRNLWDGVTLMYEKHSSGVFKCSYLIQPGSALDAVDRIRLRYNMPVKVDANGDLVLLFATGEMRESRPVAWQEMEGRRVSVDVAYRLIGGGEVGFNAGSYNPCFPLVIDPVLSWNTFLGGSSWDNAAGIAVDKSGNIYVVGKSSATWGSPVRPYSDWDDAYVAKLSASGILQWNTFLGGSESGEYGTSIALDTSGNIYVAGTAYGTWGSPIRPFLGGYSDIFVAKLNGSGTLQWNTFLGSGDDSGQGLGDDYGNGIAVDTNGNIYVTGASDKTWGSPIRLYTGVKEDTVVAKLSNSGALQWNTFLGSSYADYGYAIALDASGNAYVTGSSYGTWGSPVRSYSGGVSDAFVARLNASGALQWNAFLGGASWDIGYAITVDKSGNLYVAGASKATWGLPARPFAGSCDAFVTKLNGSGALQWNTFLGSSSASNYDVGYGIAVDKSGNVCVAGVSDATWGSPVRPYAGGLTDAFIARLNASGALQWNAFLGGSGQDDGLAIAVSASGNICVSGDSYATWGSSVRPFGGPIDAFVAMISASLMKNDFNGDGQEDILWRYYSSGGKNMVWYMKGVTRTGSSSLLAVSDLNWKIGGTGDFNGDGWPDILWRYYGSGGTNVVWYMKGATRTGSATLPAVTDLNWQIGGTGDFNGDGWPDILWRYNGSGGKNVVWYMKGATRTGTATLPAITDLNWKVGGTGDFNRDGWPDILWRYNGPGGKNVVWYMKGATRTGSSSLLAVTDLNWEIAGTGDFNGDGWPDILWRYYGSGGKNMVWYMKGASRTGSASLLAVTDLNWQVENH
jgi:hypothetical protein